MSRVGEWLSHPWIRHCYGPYAVPVLRVVRATAFVLLAVSPLTVAHAQSARPAAPNTALAAVADDFVRTTLSFTPAFAVMVGLHEWKDPASGKAVSLDTLLDDFSPSELARQRRYLTDIQRRLATIPRERLDPQSQADYDVIARNVALLLFGLDEERFFETRPQMYAEVLGNAIFSPMSLEYADKATRATHVVARIRQVPRFLADARRSLKATNPVYTKVALGEADGMFGLITQVAPALAKGTVAEAPLAAATKPALDAVNEFKVFVKDTLPHRAEVNWRMGASRYATKWKYLLAGSTTPDVMLRVAQDSIRVTRQQMLALARPLHDEWFPEHHHAGSGDTLLNAIVGETMARIGNEHSPRDSLFQVTNRDVAMLERVVRDQSILSIDRLPNVEVIPTPVFMRGIFAVAGAQFAPIFQPKLASFYWVTPIDPATPEARAESRLREYNRYKMLDLSIHEGVPGHLTQGTYAALVTPEWRRVLRGVYSNTPYVEGWAVYAEHVMIHDAGVNGGDPVKMQLTYLKSMLRVYQNAMLDILLHTRNLPGDSAVTMMMRDGFQERAEAEAKLQRAQLDYVQLETYMAGVYDWMAFRTETMRREGSAFDMCRFHDTVLMYGALPVPEVRRLYFAQVRPELPPGAMRCAAAKGTKGTATP